MLILGRRPYQAILIDIDGRLVKVKAWPKEKGQARIAVEAPHDIPIVRQELAQKDDKRRRG